MSICDMAPPFTDEPLVIITKIFPIIMLILNRFFARSCLIKDSFASVEAEMR